jgi:hypothetical protein
LASAPAVPDSANPSLIVGTWVAVQPDSGSLELRSDGTLWEGARDAPHTNSGVYSVSGKTISLNVSTYGMMSQSTMRIVQLDPDVLIVRNPDTGQPTVYERQQPGRSMVLNDVGSYHDLIVGRWHADSTGETVEYRSDGTESVQEADGTTYGGTYTEFRDQLQYATSRNAGQTVHATVIGLDKTDLLVLYDDDRITLYARTAS